jgi:hypothetical protein
LLVPLSVRSSRRPGRIAGSRPRCSPMRAAKWPGTADHHDGRQSMLIVWPGMALRRVAADRVEHAIQAARPPGSAPLSVVRSRPTRSAWPEARLGLATLAALQVPAATSTAHATLSRPGPDHGWADRDWSARPSRARSADRPSSQLDATAALGGGRKTGWAVSGESGWQCDAGTGVSAVKIGAMNAWYPSHGRHGWRHGLSHGRSHGRRWLQC